ncbi:MAG: stage II sporulation protein D [Ruminococcaceae bacterium]|nr:stage II sporulation protein D [Oscillospiraceae bacterium]
MSFRRVADKQTVTIMAGGIAMKNKELHIALTLGVLLPCMMLLLACQPGWNLPSIFPTEATEPSESGAFRVLMADGTVQGMDLEDYIWGVVLAEMPASYEVEALKAQAVAARTYALRTKRHENANICTDYGCCQAYVRPENYTGGAKFSEKVRQAVLSTAGQVVTYAGELIEATYFSCSGGRTEDAAAVWGADVPYLQSVPSPGEENSSDYMKTVSMSAEEFAAAFDGLSGTPGSWIGKITYTNGGGVATIEIGGTEYKGTTVRQKLKLRSTAFVITVVGSSVSITTKGFGHRVGLSQDGAEAMAVGGSDYADILAHYYPGTRLQGIDNIGALG